MIMGRSSLISRRPSLIARAIRDTAVSSRLLDTGDQIQQRLADSLHDHPGSDNVLNESVMDLVGDQSSFTILQFQQVSQEPLFRLELLQRVFLLVISVASSTRPVISPMVRTGPIRMVCQAGVSKRLGKRISRVATLPVCRTCSIALRSNLLGPGRCEFENRSCRSPAPWRAGCRAIYLFNRAVRAKEQNQVGCGVGNRCIPRFKCRKGECHHHAANGLPSRLYR